MKILHIVTLVSSTGAFGGPLRVALNQAAELARRDHEVLLVAGHDGLGEPPAEVGGVPARLFDARRALPDGAFSSLFSGALVKFLLRESASYDVVHVHAGRDLISQTSIAAIRRSGTPYVVQTHGMIAPDHRLKARLFDAAFVRRQLAGAQQRLTLTAYEEGQLQEVLRPANSRLPFQRLQNGVPFPKEPGPLDAQEVLYCARMHPRKRPELFVAAAAKLHPRHPQARFPMIGPDEGSLASVVATTARLGLDHVIPYEGSLSYEDVLERMARTGIYVLPSVDEPFPMSLLEAMSLGVPSIITDTCGIAHTMQRTGGAVVTDGSLEQIVAAIDTLLSDASERRRQGQRGREVVRQFFSIESVVDELELTYARATVNHDR